MSVKYRYEGMQSILGVLNTDGCLFLTILSIAEEESKKEIDLLNAIRFCMSKGWVKSDFTVADSPKLLNHYTDKTWTRREVDTLPATIADNEYTVAIYYNPRTKYKHFRRRGFDTLINSVTVAEGKVIGYYIYTCN